MPVVAHRTCNPHLEEIEVLVLLPVGGCLAILRVGIREPLSEPAGFIALEFEEIVDEHLSDRSRERGNRDRARQAQRAGSAAA